MLNSEEFSYNEGWPSRDGCMLSEKKKEKVGLTPLSSQSSF